MNEDVKACKILGLYFVLPVALILLSPVIFPVILWILAILYDLVNMPQPIVDITIFLLDKPSYIIAHIGGFIMRHSLVVGFSIVFIFAIFLIYISYKFKQTRK